MAYGHAFAGVVEPFSPVFRPDGAALYKSSHGAWALARSGINVPCQEEGTGTEKKKREAKVEH